MSSKVAVVTGGTKGIGKAIVQKFLSEGCRVYINFANDIESATAFKREIQDEYATMYQFIQADLSSYEGVEKLIYAIKEREREVNYLVLNAGVTCRSSVKEINLENWNAVINTNLTMPFFIVKGFFEMFSQNGTILFIGSVLGIYPHAISIPYAVTKAGIHMLTKQLVKDFIGKSINVNAIIPGFVETPWQKNKATEHRKRIENKIALHRFAESEEIASLCWHCVENRYINGALLQIDGGYCYE